MIILPSSQGFFRKQGGAVSGAKLIIDASSTASYPGNGTVWYDISGNGNNFNIVQGAWNSAGYMDFKGSYGVAKNSVDINLSSYVTYVVVTRIKNYIYDWRTLTNSTHFAYNNNNTLIGGDRHVTVESYYYGVSALKAYRFQMYDQDNVYGIRANGVNGATYAEQTNLPGYGSNNFDVMIWRWSDNDNPTWDMNVNGNQFGTIIDGYARYNRGFGAIGGSQNGSTDPSNSSEYWGDINYFAVYDRRLTDTEVTQSYQYLRTRYNN